MWEFWIDVGGTFTDCIARSPQGELVTVKTLSSGMVKGQVAEIDAADAFIDGTRIGDADNFWAGWQLRVLDAAGNTTAECRVAASRAAEGRLTLAGDLPAGLQPGTRYELTSGEEAPIVAIRRVLGLRLDQPIPEVSVRLGTTRGTNALLTRTGARTVFVTTRGLGDVLRIANQDRPKLFELTIHRLSPLFEQVIEVDERLAADGSVLTPLDEAATLTALQAAAASGMQSVAICLLNAWASPVHEERVEQLARQAGFEEVSTSSRLAPLIRIVARGDTTVMDAYLNPVLREYVDRLRQSLGRSTLRIMTSAGGLVAADHFVGKDSILSGPAGGVIGFSRVARQAGFERSIGFDMGGTSTDVSRFNGDFEMEYETVKAGVRVVSPTLAIETVAAGGGSVCRFDGVKLAVGPQSAGADPGPACYGRGGPLTVTDVNLFLGRLPADRFPFPLDRDVVRQRLEDLCAELAAGPLKWECTPAELAEGFVEIANASMARAIRRISIEKGSDPADYALVTFGGAGAQHACGLARMLGIRDILIHPHAGILSALGIGLADVRRFAEQAVLQPDNDETRKRLDGIFAELEAAATSQVREEGVPEELIDPPQRSLDMRYAGVESTINVSCPADGDYAAEYERLHQQQYGYTHSGRSLEIVAARVSVVGRTRAPAEPALPEEPRTPAPARTAEVMLQGRPQTASVFFREQLQPGDRIEAPAILCEDTSTILIEPGFLGRIASRGELILTAIAEETPPADSSGPEAVESTTAADIDPVLLEVFNNLFASIAEQMGVTLQHTSCSTNVKERLDFSCAVFSPEGDLVVNAPHIPVHLGAMSETVRGVLADNPGLAPGDVFVTNDPYRGGSHLPDVTVVLPVHEETTGELLFLTAARAHHAEIGGIVPGSMPPFSQNLAEEGVLIRNFRLVHQGQSREQALRELLLSGPYPTRNVADNLSDISAQVAACRMGARLLLDQVARYSLPVVHGCMHRIQEAASAKMRLALARIPDRIWSRTDHLDDGSPIAVQITIEGERATVDFTGTGPVLATSLNANRAIVTAAVMYVFRCLIADDIPLNSGVLEPVKIVLPECLLNPPGNPDPALCPAVVGGNVETSQRVVDVLLGALELAAASQGTMNNLTFGDGSFGYYETICGGAGATAEAPGASAVHTHMTNTRLTDAEIVEHRYPVRVREFSIRQGSGGAGAHTGGCGVTRRLEFLRPLSVSMLSQRRGKYRPFGLHGGEPGAAGRNLLTMADGTTRDVGGCFAEQVQQGDMLTIETPGGGGWGEAGG